MRFNKIIDELSIYLNKPNISKTTLKEVVLIFYNSMSKQEKEVFNKRMANFKFELFKELELPAIQTSLDKYFEKYRLFRSIKL